MDAPKRKRTGCTECRRKKSKCDEKRPVCSRCAKYPRLCTYELCVVRAKVPIHEHGSSTTPDETRLSPIVAGKQVPQVLVSDRSPQAAHTLWTSPLTVKTPCSGLSAYRMKALPDVQPVLHRFYLSHFIRDTAAIYFPLQTEQFLRFILSVTESSSCMLGAVLVASSSHYFRLTDNSHSHIAAMEATVHTLSRLQQTLKTGQTRDETLATSLMLATTCLCAGDTATYRQHVDGAIGTVARSSTQGKPTTLWSFSVKWLTHLILMDRVSRPPLQSRRRRQAINWEQLLASMPDMDQIDATTGLSFNLITLLDGVCELAEARQAVLEETGASNGQCSQDAASQARAEFLEAGLTCLRERMHLPVGNAMAAELQNSHTLFIDASLLHLYRQALKLSREHPSVQARVDSIIASLQTIDKLSHANIPLLWPLLAAGCEARTSEQRDFFSNRMADMEVHGVGNCRIALEFMTLYWQRGRNMPWPAFAHEVGADLVLF